MGKVIQTQTYKDREDGLESLTKQGQWEKRADGSWGFEGKVVESILQQAQHEKRPRCKSDGDQVAPKRPKVDPGSNKG